MAKKAGRVIELKLDGTLSSGLEVNLSISWEERPRDLEASARLMPDLQIDKIHKNWQTKYRELGSNQRIITAQEIRYDDCFEKRKSECISLSKQLKKELNDWLKAPDFQPLRRLIERVETSERVRILIRTNNEQLRRLPWNLWELLEKYPEAEIALAANNYEKIDLNLDSIHRKKLSVLAILGNSSGINIEADRQLFKKLENRADITFLSEPTRDEISKKLSQEKWDILFFAGHSETQNKIGRIYINQTDSITLEELSDSLKKAVAKGLKLAIFNSCDGLGLANYLSQLNLPQMIVMRELVPDRIAREFLKDFLNSFASGKHFYLAVKEAREGLQKLEQEFVCASWLPTIVQNPATIYPTWWSMGGIPPCPYRGLSAFRAKDARFFFGRERVTLRLLDRVKREAIVTVIGASGSGKSSLVFAGLIPQLKQQQSVKIVTMRPGNNPLESLAAALYSEQSQTNLDRLKTKIDLQENSQSLYQLIDRFVEEHLGTRFILVIDQFEELYTLCELKQQQENFLNLLINAVENAPNFCLVLTLRADFLGNAMSSLPRFTELLDNNTFFLGPMEQTELKEAIAKPAELFDVTLEAGLNETILADLALSREKLPLLEFALTQLWDERRNHLQLTQQDYDRIGGVERALAQYAKIVYEKLSPKEKLSAQKVFVQLLTIPGDNKEAVRRLAKRNEINDWNLVVRLANKRLVVTNRDVTTKVETVEIIHEALIRNWDRLKEWIRNDRYFRIWQDQLRQSIAKWKQTQRDSGSLLRGLQLVEAKKWLQNKQGDLGRDEVEYINASVKQERKSRRQLQIGIAVSTMIAAIATGLGFFANGQRFIAQEQTKNAQEQTREAEKQKLIAQRQKLIAQREASIANLRAKAIEAINLLSSNPVEGLVKTMAVFAQTKKSQLEKELPRVRYSLSEFIDKAREEVRIAHSDSVRSVASSPDGTKIASASGNTVKVWDLLTGEELAQFTGHTGFVNSVAFSPDGTKIASASGNTVKLWDLLAEQELAQFTGHTGFVNSVAFSPDGTKIASASDDLTVRLWDLSGRELAQFIGHAGYVNSVAFSPDGRKIASASNDKTVRLWDLSGRQLAQFTGHANVVNSVAFSPDGRKIASASDDRMVRVWDLSGRRLNIFRSYKGFLNSVAFSPDGTKIASTSNAGTVTLWHLSVGLIAQFTGHTGYVNSVAFSPDGRKIASASDDRTVRIWNITGNELAQFTPHTGSVRSVAFSLDEIKIASVSDDKTVTISNFTGKELVQFTHKGSVNRKELAPFISISDTSVVNGKELAPFISDNTTIYALSSVAFSPDGRKIASVNDDKTMILLNPTGWELGQFADSFKLNSRYSYMVRSVAFSPDGRKIASASSNGTVILWDLSGRQLAQFTHTGSVFSVAFSPDGRKIASASSNGTVILWDLSGRQLAQFTHTGSVFSVAFSPDGRKIASASDDNTVILWDLKGQELAQFTHKGSVFSVAFSPDGRKIASASDDNTVRLWDLKGQELAQFTHKGSVLSVAFSPDGRKIVSISDDNTVRLWDLKGQELAQFTHTSSVLSVAFSPDGRKIVSISDDNTVRLWESNSTNLLSLACNRLQYHSVLLKAETEDALAAGNACLKYSNWNNHEKAEFQSDRGLALSRKGNYSQGAIDLKAAQKRNSKIDLNPDTKQRETNPDKVAQQLAAQTILLDAIALAKQEKTDQAIERFKQAQTIYPQIDLNPDTKELDRDPEKVAARLLLPIKGIPLAKRERIEEALDRTLGNIPADSALTNDGIKINSPTPVFRIVDNALYFDRIKDCVKVPDNPALNFGTGDFSISIWIKTTDRSGINPILDKRIETSGPIQGYSLFNYQGRLGLQLADGTSWNNYISNTSISDGRWHQVTVSIDRDSPSGGKWYVDGQLVDSFNPTGRVGSLSNSAPLTFGRNSDNPFWPGYFNGSLDEVMLFDRSLSPSQVRKLYYDSLN